MQLIRRRNTGKRQSVYLGITPNFGLNIAAKYLKWRFLLKYLLIFWIFGASPIFADSLNPYAKIQPGVLTAL